MSGALRTYDAARAALYALVPRGVVLGLDPVRDALRALGDPQARVPVIHVAGTNGKGSVAAMVDASLRAAGKRVGLYTSPHLHRFSERVRVGGAPVEESALADAAWRVLDGMDSGALPPLTFFEATTVTAWLAFERAGLDACVLEVGLGGRLDATNVCTPAVTAITRIALDHEALLGSTLTAVAREKAGILKRGVACVLGPDLVSGEARAAIESVAVERSAPLVPAPDARVLSVADDQRARVEVRLAAGTITADLGLPGAHQVGNAAVAAGLLEHMGVSLDHVRAGLERAMWPGRMERVGSLLLDAAHNPDGAASLAASLARMRAPRERVALVMGASSDKDWRAMLDALAPAFDPPRRFFCAASLRRAEDPAALAAYAQGRACTDVADALARARDSVQGERGLVVVCGSIFVVAEARARALGIEEDPPIGM